MVPEKARGRSHTLKDTLKEKMMDKLNKPDERLKEMNTKLQTMLEETLTKNIQLQKVSIDNALFLYYLFCFEMKLQTMFEQTLTKNIQLQKVSIHVRYKHLVSVLLISFVCPCNLVKLFDLDALVIHVISWGGGGYERSFVGKVRALSTRF